MPTKHAVRTSVLSKRWRYSWMYVTNLDFDDIHPPHGEKIVVNALKLCKTSRLNLFRLCSEYYIQPLSVLSWINEAVKLNVNELDIQVIKLGLPLSMFTCKTLTKLRLVSMANYWELPLQANLPCLKTLDVTVYTVPLGVTSKLINGCPMLENLSLEVKWREDEGDYVFNIPTLKRLKLKRLNYASSINKVVLNLPNLEYLSVGGFLYSIFVMEDVSSLVEASISFSEIKSCHVWVELLKGLSGVKSLSVQLLSSSIDYKALLTSPLPIFPNLNHLELKESWHSGLILHFLESSSELKHLCIEEVIDPSFKEPIEYSWAEPKFVPACMRTKLTTIKFSACEWWKSDLPFLKYMLGNAEVLKTVAITMDNLSVEAQMQLRDELHKFPRACWDCEIHFHEI